MNKILNISGKIIYAICQPLALIIVEIIAAVYMLIYKIKN